MLGSARNGLRTLFFSLKQCTTSCYSSPYLRHEQLGTCFFSCSAAQPCTIFEKMYGGCCRNRTKFQRHWEVAICCVFGKYTVQRQIHPSFLRTGFGDMQTYRRLRSKRTIFDKVWEISILLFVKFFTAFVILVPRASVSFGHVVGETEGCGSSNYRMSVYHGHPVAHA